MRPQTDATAALVVRAWSEAGASLPLRFRVTQSLDLRSEDQDVQVVASVDELLELVEQWANQYCRRHLLR